MVLMIQPHDHDDRDSGGPADCIVKPQLHIPESGAEWATNFYLSDTC